ncbi:HEAT repeat domain-containing protein [Myxococcota bacterium]|nr:HEAT repeat domain-containing protein [Myxococcota bacterium]
MTHPGPGSESAGREPLDVAVEALGDLAAGLRGGGPRGVEPETIATAFAEALSELARQRPVTLQVRPQGLLIDGDPFWVNDLLARRVGAGLDAQGLAEVRVQASAELRTVRALAVLLAREWSTEGAGALRGLVERGRTPGVDFTFHSTVPVARGGGLEPGVLLHVLRSSAGAPPPDLQPALDAIRERLALPPDVASAIAGVGLGGRQALQAEIRSIHLGEDVPWDLMGRVAFDVMRLDTAGLQAADTFRLIVDHVEQLLARGRAQDALALLHRPLSLVDAQVVPGWPHREVVRAEVGALFDPRSLERMVSAANASREGLDAWRELLFTLGSVVPADRLDAACLAWSGLDRAPLRQAVADGVLLACGRDLEPIDRLLARQAGPGAAIPLLALGRLDAPMLLERLLARMDSEHALVRQAALTALRRHRSPRTQERVRKALADPSSAVRVEALRYVSVYRDAEAAGLIMERMRNLRPDEAEEDELRALGMAFALIGRQEAVLPLTRLVQEAGERRPGAVQAGIAGLLALGESGRSALHGLSRSSPELRRAIRAAGVVE